MKPGSADHQSSEAKDLVVFDILRESKCTDCGKELLGGDFLFMEGKRPLCLTCADLDHLVYLPRGDTALTRRARKHSALSAVVVRFSRARKRYERQGVLVEESALEQAEAECSADADQRNVRRERAEIYRDKQIRFWRCEWLNRFDRCFQAARLRRRGPSQHIRRFGAAAEWVEPPPGEHWRKKRYERRWWHPSATGIRNTIAFL
jgi:hypothetical protein